MTKTIRDYSTPRHERVRSPGVRVAVLFLFLAFGAGLVVWKLTVLMVLQHKFYSSLASDQQEIYQKLFPLRGDIVVRDRRTGEFYAVATNRTMTMVYADPRKIKDAVDSAERLAPFIGIVIPEDKPENAEVRAKALEAKQDFLNKLARKNDPYEVLAHALDDEAVEKIKALKIEGIKFVDERIRFYPEAKLGGHVTGFVGFDEAGNRVGRYGIEGHFERELAGRPGFLQSAKGATGGWIALDARQVEPAEDGATVVLTIDRAVQYFACERLRAAVAEHGAERGALVILEAKTGAVLALCSVPDFDPNNYREVGSLDVYNNTATFSSYEPGSVMKTMTLAAAIDAEALSPSSTYEDKGKIQIGDHTISNADGGIPHGVQTMTQVLEKSLNTGAVYAAEKIPYELFTKYLYNFGFGATTGIELDTEAAGTLVSLDKSGRIFRATASYGQGITTTPLQVAAAYLAIANQGKLMRPYIVEEVRLESGRVTKTQPTTVRQVVSARTASLVAAMLTSVIERGHGKKAGVPGYWVAGKTGTAEIAIRGGVYDAHRTVGTFAGFAPVDDPRFVLVTRLDAPKTTDYAEATAAPLFGEIAKFLLQYLEVPPTR